MIESDPQADDTAWKIHAAQADWTGKVDAKATFAFAIESAGVATTIALSTPDRVFGQMTDPALWVMYWVGLIALIVGVMLAAWAVVPRLGTDTETAAKRNFIYFGHARHWDEESLAKALTEEDVVPQLARQIVVMANTAWNKHVYVRASFVFALTGAVFLLLAGVVTNIHF